MALLAIYNPVCGARQAARLFTKDVLPLLQRHGKNPTQVIETTHAGHAGKVVVEYLRQNPGPLSVVLGSGDGTLHEIIVALHDASLATNTQIKIAIVPCGTANALYWSLFPLEGGLPDSADKLQSLHNLLSPTPPSRPLKFAVTSFHTEKPPSSIESKTSIGTVVVSTSLHASILHDSEALRESVPGIERFKIAAEQNANRWYDARVKLFPAPGSPSVQIYDPKQKQFRQWADEGVVELSGPFAYFLSTINVDRLEAKFRITPLHTALPPAEAVLDVVILRPLRDESISADSDDARKGYATKTYEVLMAAYQDGAHVDITYGDKDKSSVVEYFRCGGWEWIPEPDSSIERRSHRVCIDGEIIVLEPTGKATCSATDNIHNIEISIFS